MRQDKQPRHVEPLPWKQAVLHLLQHGQTARREHECCLLSLCGRQTLECKECDDAPRSSRKQLARAWDDLLYHAASKFPSNTNLLLLLSRAIDCNARLIPSAMAVIGGGCRCHGRDQQREKGAMRGTQLRVLTMRLPGPEVPVEPVRRRASRGHVACGWTDGQERGRRLASRTCVNHS